MLRYLLKSYSVFSLHFNLFNILFFLESIDIGNRNMANKTISPKIEIIKHFDELINQVDIDIEKSLEKYNENQVLGDLEIFKIDRRKFEIRSSFDIIIDVFETSNQIDSKPTVDQWAESTKIVDYLSQVRKRTIEELRKAQEECLENYKRDSTRLNASEKFYFNVSFPREPYEPWFFGLYTFACDFYLSRSEIQLFE